MNSLIAKCYKHGKFFKVDFMHFSLEIHQTKSVFLVYKLMTRCLLIFGQLEANPKNPESQWYGTGVWAIMQSAVLPKF